MDKKVLKSLKDILEKNKLLTLSTTKNNQPHSNTAYYVFDKNFNIYIWGEKNSAHFRNLLQNKKVAINIFDSSQKWGSLLQGIQAMGIAMPVNSKELIKAGLLYIKRFPSSLKMVKNPKGFHHKIFDSQLYKIKLNKIKVFDEKEFGKGNSREVSI
ncbi:MAG: pyridoxamine 5'-phosphate oxidase family protein [Nanoarchaeota archaeon]